MVGVGATQATMVDADEYNADADSIVLGTQGTEYCKFTNIQRFQIKKTAGGIVTTYYGGKTHTFKDGKVVGFVRFEADIATRAEVNYIDQYYSKHKDPEDNLTYLYFMFATDDFTDYYNEASVLKDGVPGIL